MANGHEPIDDTGEILVPPAPAEQTRIGSFLIAWLGLIAILTGAVVGALVIFGVSRDHGALASVLAGLVAGLAAATPYLVIQAVLRLLVAIANGVSRVEWQLEHGGVERRSGP